MVENYVYLPSSWLILVIIYQNIQLKRPKGLSEQTLHHPNSQEIYWKLLPFPNEQNTTTQNTETEKGKELKIDS